MTRAEHNPSADGQMTLKM